MSRVGATLDPLVTTAIVGLTMIASGIDAALEGANKRGGGGGAESSPA